MIQWLTHNWGLKLVSFFLAVGLWYYATGEEGIEVSRFIPVDIQVENTHMSISRVSARTVEVTFIAPRALVSDLTSENIKASHKIEESINKPGDYSFRLEPGAIKLRTPQIRVVKIQPETIQVTLDELIVQKLAVKPNFLGEPAFGYSLTQEQIQLNPNAVLIEGPKALLEKMDSVKTAQIDLVGRVRSFRRMYGLDLPSTLKAVSEDMIDVYVPIQEAYDEKTFDGVQVKLLGSQGKGQVTLEPSVVSLSLRGPQKQFEGLTAAKLVAYVDISDRSEGEFDLPLQLFLPEGVKQKSEKPVTVHVRIDK
jgi:YbbR domain-containing protein